MNEYKKQIFEDLDNLKKIGTTARDMAFMKSIEDWIEEGFKEAKIINHKDKFQWQFKLDDGTYKKGNINTYKSFASIIEDINIASGQYSNSCNQKAKASVELAVQDGWINIGECEKFIKSINSMQGEDYFEWVFKFRGQKIYTTILSWVLVKCKKLGIYKFDKYPKENRFKILDPIFSYISKEYFQEYLRIQKLEERPLPKTEENFDTNNKIISMTFSDLIALVEKEELKIPNFQRDFGWKANQSISLLNSIYRDLPIGSFMIGKTDFDFKPRNEIIKNIASKNYKKLKPPYKILLDGQQRLTSIVLSFYYQKIKDTSKYSAFNKIIFVPGAEYADKNNNRVHKADVFWDSDAYAKALKQEIIINKGKKPCNLNDIHIQDYLKEFEKIFNYEVPIVLVSNDGDGIGINKFVSVFQRINSGSKKLTNIDLLHAALTSNDNRFDLLGRISEIINCKTISFFNLKSEQIIQMAKIKFDYERYSVNNSEIKINNKSVLKIGFIKADAEEFIDIFSSNKFVNAIEKTIELLQRKTGITKNALMPNNSFLLTLFLLNLKGADETKIDKVLRRIVIRTLNKDYSSGTATKIKKDLNIILKDDYEYSEGYDKTRIIEDLRKANYNNKNGLYKLVIGMLTLLNPLSLIDGETKVRTMALKWYDPDKDQHHIIPKKSKQFKSISVGIANSIANIVLISNDENRNIIRNKDINDYILSGTTKDTDKIEKLSKTHLLPIDKMKTLIQDQDTSVLEGMLEERIELIAKRFMAKYLGN